MHRHLLEHNIIGFCCICTSLMRFVQFKGFSLLLAPQGFPEDSELRTLQTWQLGLMQNHRSEHQLNETLIKVQKASDFIRWFSLPLADCVSPHEHAAVFFFLGTTENYIHWGSLLITNANLHSQRAKKNRPFPRHHTILSWLITQWSHYAQTLMVDTKVWVLFKVSSGIKVLIKVGLVIGVELLVLRIEVLAVLLHCMLMTYSLLIQHLLYMHTQCKYEHDLWFQNYIHNTDI